MIYVFVNINDGGQCRMAVEDCNGNRVTVDDVASIEYTVYKVNRFSGQYTPVAGHVKISITPAAAMLDAFAVDEETGDDYNFEYVVSSKNVKPFPERRSMYHVEITLTDLAGEHCTAVFPFTTDDNYYSGAQS